MDVGIGHLPVDLTAYGGDFRNLPHEILSRHVELGHAFLEAGGDMPPACSRSAFSITRRWTAAAIPLGLKGDQIDLLSRMAAICDTYDSMVSDTAEGCGVNPATAIGQMNFMKGWFDPESHAAVHRDDGRLSDRIGGAAALGAAGRW
jgi:response regulator RpfG family c-di-GMP phosphodiesterase